MFVWIFAIGLLLTLFGTDPGGTVVVLGESFYLSNLLLGASLYLFFVGQVWISFDVARGARSSVGWLALTLAITIASSYLIIDLLSPSYARWIAAALSVILIGLAAAALAWVAVSPPPSDGDEAAD